MKETLRHTRESWLETAIDVMRAWFVDAGYELPEKVHVSVGFSGSARPEKKVMGCTWARRASEDNVNHVFISPALGDTYDVLETLLHELIHVADDCVHGHRERFVDIAKALDLQPPWTYTQAPPQVAAELVVLAAELGQYPHGVLNPVRVPVSPGTTGKGNGAVSVDPGNLTSGPKKQSTRMIKLVCPCCGYTVRTTRRWIAEGLPSCPLSTPMKEA